MTTTKRKPPNAGKGRKKGSVNKMTASAKQAFAYAFDAMGGPRKLAQWAEKNPTEFYKLYARLIPVEQHVSGADGEKLSLTVSFHAAD